MKTVTLNNGVVMPMLGMGVYQIPNPAECERVVRDALEVGYRSIDTAQAYGNEEAVGKAVAACGVPREQLFLTSKVWISNASYERAKASIDESLRKMGLDYLDLMLIHQPYGDYYGTYRAMEEAYKAGKLRAIGVSNFAPDRLMDLALNNEVVPAVNQLETHPFQQQKAALPTLKELGVQIESWGPFAEGKNGLFTNPELVRIAASHGKSVAQVVLNYLMACGVVVIPKSTHRERILENFNVFDFRLAPQDMADIAALDGGTSLFLDHRDPDTVKWLVNYK